MRREFNPDTVADAEATIADMKNFMEVMEPHLEQALAEVGAPPHSSQPMSRPA